MRGMVMIAGLIGSFAVMSACDDSEWTNTIGASAPRLSASLSENAPSSPVYSARVLVLPPPPVATPTVRGGGEVAGGDASAAPVAPLAPVAEYLSLVAADGALLSLNGSDPAAKYCAKAATEQVFEVTSATGTPSLTITLGRWVLDGGAPVLGPNSNCSPASSFEGEETIVVNIPSAPTETKSDAASPIDSGSDESIDAGGQGDAADATGTGGDK